MSAETEPVDGTAVRLRAEFDRMFATPVTPAAGERAAFLAIRIGGDPFALPLAGLLGIHVDRKIIPVPSASSTLLGIAAFRGALTSIHDLRIILGYPARSAPRWLALASMTPPVGLAFEAFEGQFATSDAAATSGHGGAPAGNGAPLQPALRAGFTRGLVHAFDAVRPVIDVAAIVAAILAATFGASAIGPRPQPPTEER